MTTVADGLYQYGGMPVFGGVPPFVSGSSKTFFVDPVNGADGNSGKSPDDAFASLYRAHYMMTAGNNDVCYLIGDGSTTATCRLSLANALAAQGPAETAATTGTLTWSKNACHLIGITAPTQVNQRCRISTPTGTYTSTTFGATNMMAITASGCYFANLSISQGFSTGADGEITVTMTGDQNYFNNVHIGFPSSAAAIAGTSTRAIAMTGAAESTFEVCTFGLDTITRSVANATMEFKTACARMIFRKCLFFCHSSSADALQLVGTGNNCLQRFALFDDCLFMDNSYAGATALTVVASMTTNNPGGAFIFSHSQVVSASTAEWGDANALVQSRVDNVGGAGTAGIMLRPT